MKNDIHKFVESLSNRRNSSTVFNPYKNQKIANNLQVYLEFMARQKGDKILLVGEAPGYKGCRITGIPFTSGRLIRAREYRIFEEIESQIYLTDIESENSASLVWKTLADQYHYPLFWNAFPFHPHPKSVQNKNRAPNQQEMKEGAGYLEGLVRLFSPEKIAGIGRKGTQSLEGIFPDKEILYIRHPSYGGKQDFISGMKQLLA